MSVPAESAETRRRPGRPRKFPAEMAAIWADGGPRRAADMTYATLAWTFTREDAGLSWLTDRWTILNELGRLLDEAGPATMLAAAGHLCSSRPKARIGAAYVRSVRRSLGGARGGRGQKPLADRLSRAIIDIINEALSADAALTVDDALEALDTARYQMVPTTAPATDTRQSAA